MGKQLVLISHGLFCEELKKSTEMIMGLKRISTRYLYYQKMALKHTNKSFSLSQIR